MIATTLSFCRSLFTGDTLLPPTDQAQNRLQADATIANGGNAVAGWTISIPPGLASMRPSLRRVKDNAPYLSIQFSTVGASLLATFLTLFLLASVLCPSAHASELTDLGESLSYLRVHAIDDSAKGLTAALRERDALVLDLRHVATTADSAQLLLTSFKTRELKQPVFILIGPATPAALAALLTTSTNKFITLGIKESIPMPRVIIDQPAATDRLAFEALDAGQPIATLISGKISKERFDEAALMIEFNNGNLNAAPPPPPDPTTKPSEQEKIPATTAKVDDKAAAKSVEVLTDRVLQRALHLHRAMIALRR